jgi:hypothetical protein
MALYTSIRLVYGACDAETGNKAYAAARTGKPGSKRVRSNSRQAQRIGSPPSSVRSNSRQAQRIGSPPSSVLAAWREEAGDQEAGDQNAPKKTKK